MKERKSLKDISWQVDEPTYREYSSLSYSTLAKYERSGFNQLDTLFDKLETPSLMHGSAVDCLITDGQEEFDNRFMVADFNSCSDNIIKIVKDIFNNYCKIYSSLEDIDNDKILNISNIYNYQLNWKPETRAKVIKEKGSEYYSLLYLAKDKIILNTKEYHDVINSVTTLKESITTKWYFESNNPFDDIERFYQLKFKATLEGIEYKCMLDEIIVNHKTKKIFLIDLKTSSHTEWDFYKSFIDWNYSIQARLYYRIVEYVLSKDEYFKNFDIVDFRFIVVNKKTLTPLVWVFPDVKSIGTLYYGKNKQIECRDPFIIGNELTYYLSSRPKVPIGISRKEINNLDTWLNTL